MAPLNESQPGFQRVRPLYHSALELHDTTGGVAPRKLWITRGNYLFTGEHRNAKISLRLNVEPTGTVDTVYIAKR